jgi:hypothetical protein
MLAKISFSLSCLLIVTARIVVFGAGIGDALAVAALAGLYGFSLYLESQKVEPINEEVKRDLQILRDQVNTLKVAKAMGR